MIASLLLMSAPALAATVALAFTAPLALRRREFWRWAVPVSSIAGTLIASVIYVSSIAELRWLSALARPVIVLAAAPLMLLQPVMGETDPVVLAPLLPLVLSLGWSSVVLAAVATGRWIAADRRGVHRAEE